jgi:hypothetical protein
MSHSERREYMPAREGEPLPDWVYRIKESNVCPKCGKAALDTRVHRPAMVKLLLFWLPLRRFECSFCFKRSYIR